MNHRKYDVISPKSEQELGDMLRREALASGALMLIVLEQSNDIDRRTKQAAEEEIRLMWSKIENNGLPFITGTSTRYTESGPVSGNARLQVEGTIDIPEAERPLTLDVVEVDQYLFDDHKTSA